LNTFISILKTQLLLLLPLLLLPLLLLLLLLAVSGLISRGMTGTGLRVRGGNRRFKIFRARFEDGIQLN
jgi:hypothetical protein